MKKPFLFVFLLLIALLMIPAACTAGEEQPGTATPVSGPAAGEARGMGMGMGMGQGRGMAGGMAARHHAEVPEEYAGLANPAADDPEAVERGAALFALHCATCHGETGLGDGPGGAELDPAPAVVAHTARMLGDDFVFWRISEGGAQEPFNSAMPAWGEVLTEDERWDVVSFLRTLTDSGN